MKKSIVLSILLLVILDPTQGYSQNPFDKATILLGGISAASAGIWSHFGSKKAKAYAQWQKALKNNSPSSAMKFW